MDLTKIIHIQGATGLYKIVSQTDKVTIAESLTDKKRVPITSGYGVINLEMATVFSHSEEDGMRMHAVFKAIHERQATVPLPDKKAIDLVFKEYFKACVPDYVEAKVYPSVIKKIFSWYTILKDSGFDFEDTPEEAANEETAPDAPTED